MRHENIQWLPIIYVDQQGNCKMPCQHTGVWSALETVWQSRRCDPSCSADSKPTTCKGRKCWASLPYGTIAWSRTLSWRPDPRCNATSFTCVPRLLDTSGSSERVWARFPLLTWHLPSHSYCILHCLRCYTAL